MSSSFPQSQTQCHTTLPFRSLCCVGYSAVILENFCPAISFTVLFPFRLSQPQLVRFPLRSDWVNTTHSFPQSQRHFHALSVVSTAFSNTVSFPNRIPVKSMRWAAFTRSRFKQPQLSDTPAFKFRASTILSVPHAQRQRHFAGPLSGTRSSTVHLPIVLPDRFSVRVTTAFSEWLSSLLFSIVIFSTGPNVLKPVQNFSFERCMVFFVLQSPIFSV